MSRHGSDGMVSARSIELACTAKSVEKCQLFIIIMNFFFVHVRIMKDVYFS
jgi:hypothetical protein